MQMLRVLQMPHCHLKGTQVYNTWSNLHEKWPKMVQKGQFSLAHSSDIPRIIQCYFNRWLLFSVHIHPTGPSVRGLKGLFFPYAKIESPWCAVVVSHTPNGSIVPSVWRGGVVVWLVHPGVGGCTFSPCKISFFILRSLLMVAGSRLGCLQVGWGLCSVVAPHSGGARNFSKPRQAIS